MSSGGARSRALDHIRRTYDRWARDDAFYAVLTSKSKQGNRWDPEAFFASGREEVDGVMQYLAAQGASPARGRALDFGCGVGRLSQALAHHFEQVVGVDVSQEMVRRAREHDRHGEDRVRYLVNTTPTLAALGRHDFDFVYSNITLQHIPPRLVRGYVAEFFRVLRPGGIALFQMKSGPPIRSRLRAWLYRLNREHLRHLFQRIQGKPPYEIHFIARSELEAHIRACGGELLDVVDTSKGRGRSFRYLARARATADR